jgi:hypothetical protein
MQLQLFPVLGMVRTGCADGCDQPDLERGRLCGWSIQHRDQSRRRSRYYQSHASAPRYEPATQDRLARIALSGDRRRGGKGPDAGGPPQGLRSYAAPAGGRRSPVGRHHGVQTGGGRSAHLQPVAATSAGEGSGRRASGRGCCYPWDGCVGLRRRLPDARRDDRYLAAARLAELDALEAACNARIVPIDGAVTVEWARLLGAKDKNQRDRALAATARVHGFVLVTRNIDDSRGCDVQVLTRSKPIRPSRLSKRHAFRALAPHTLSVGSSSPCNR